MVAFVRTNYSITVNVACCIAIVSGDTVWCLWGSPVHRRFCVCLCCHGYVLSMLFFFFFNLHHPFFLSLSLSLPYRLWCHVSDVVGGNWTGCQGHSRITNCGPMCCLSTDQTKLAALRFHVGAQKDRWKQSKCTVQNKTSVCVAAMSVSQSKGKCFCHFTSGCYYLQFLSVWLGDSTKCIRVVNVPLFFCQLNPSPSDSLVFHNEPSLVIP